MKAVLHREYGPLSTKGVLVLFKGAEILFKAQTLELPNLGNQKNCSCIPEGTYEVLKEYSKKFGNCFRILNVPNRSDILIHAGNFATGILVDTQGCILPGTGFIDINGDGNLDIVESGKAMDQLNKYLPAIFTLIIC